MKSGIDRIGHSVSVEHANRSCLDKMPYPSRNAARDAAVHIGRKRPDWPRMRPYRCTICGGFHLTTKVPNGLSKRPGQNNGKRKGASR